MERALVIGASGGIGAALCATLAGRGVSVTALSRRDHGLDVTDEASIARCLGALTGPFDLILVATGVLNGAGQPPEKALKSLTPNALAHQFAVNAAGPLLVLKHGLRLMPRDRRAVFAALSARVGSIGDNRLGGWYSYRMAKAALNQGLRTAAIELSRTHPRAICAALHPGTVATPFTAAHAARHPTVPPDQAAANLLAVIARLDARATGGFFDWSGARVPW
ncbi:SDR family NAD(P)-dependent oxidoreductase [Rhodovulum strictum]|uniref:SDR family NAD(P)-dependent oxidoreductase n=1 Tax=Rhodovulum strictum TaxID=58314 RepID=A0A844BDP1_9RHOB|nr:SDR family NAD(P)-dependent oxidoreductase [Rhodovulum strictum]MRH20739.1 SDR family NAD(P)-dependent oxidoreductase [Rhodovulum strictum]